MCKDSSNQSGRKVALYGGAFDPVHTAHIEVARAALEQAFLDEVIFVPAAQSPLKPHGPRSSDSERLEMLRLALLGEERFSLDDLELRRGGVSYTLDTVRAFKANLTDAELYWIIGADQLEQLDRWRAIEELARLVTFLVLARPGYDLKAPDIADLRCIKIDAPLMEESSTEIRARLASGRPLDRLLPERVEAFISAKGLYTSA